ncbi:hypothetical protein KEM48_006724 [Puccinia striiformis f. sp. tritici PST-130]|nr:hypothetical protein H4Q26_006998 [Puccinia striiformis f. sp. tritici PST-130]KAI9618401.1 hypothetical protein KEM48_006724 [Puccinia striiformis f. sp. tritici PST-130]
MLRRRVNQVLCLDTFHRSPRLTRSTFRIYSTPTAMGIVDLGVWLMRWGTPQDGWFRVRSEMVEEVKGNVATYSRLQGGDDSIKKIVAALKVTKISNQIPPAKWLNNMDHGQIMSNNFGRPVVFLSLESCGTFLPSVLGPKEHDPVLGAVFLLHVNGNHWVLPDVTVVDGLKPIPPVLASGKTTSQKTQGWKAHLKKELALYNKELKSQNGKK